jgi:hypothetical protein
MPPLTRTFSEGGFLFFRDVVEPPIRFIDRDSKRPAMLFKMLCCKSSDGHDLFDFSKSVPYS